ncbi:MAG: 5-bromo-4-chloroindolyl phosphate hydrolysis family protein [Lachnospiraceae bacterium]|nr:5-bromo-4-chloroindolyl phosphate hydrolysis family protein [Lachnospiraceae bacterium]
MSDFRSDLGEQIMDLVDNALNSDNYDKLSETISRQMNKLFGGDHYQNRPGGTGNNRPGGQGIYRENGTGQNPYAGYGTGGRPGQQPNYRQSGPNYQQSGPNYRQNGSAGYTGGAGNMNSRGYTAYQKRQNSAYNASNAGREAYEARRRQMMSGQPHMTGAVPNTAARNNVKNVPKQPVYFGKPTGETGGTALMVAGGVFGVNSVLSLVRAIAALFSGGGVGALVFPVFGLAVCAAAFLYGMGLNNQAKRFKKYVSILSKKMYASVKDLSAEVGKKEEFVIRDLRKMIDRKWFREGHLDDKQTTMIATDELYSQYRRTQEQADALRKEQEEIEKQYGALSKDIRDVLEKGNEYVEKIREVNHALPEPEITEKLTRLENIISKIFARVKEEPSEARNLSQFMDYYLPTTWKLVSAYQEMEEQPVQGENIMNAKKEIKESLDTINDAFETLLDSMFKEQAWDVSTDISVMKSMMKQDGLTGSDFRKPGKSAAKAQGNVAIMEEK